MMIPTVGTLKVFRGYCGRCWQMGTQEGGLPEQGSKTGRWNGHLLHWFYGSAFRL